MLDEVKTTIEYILTSELNNNPELDELVRYRHLADYYRHGAQKELNEPKKISLNTLSEYPDVDFRIELIENIGDDNIVLVRDSLTYLTTWAYQYGSLKGEYENPDMGENGDELVKELNERIETRENLTVNDVYLALKLTDEIVDAYGYEQFDESIFESEAYESVMAIIDQVNNLVKLKTDGRLNWDMMGKTFESTQQRAQEEVTRKSGKRTVIRKLRDYDGDSIESFLEQTEVV